MSSKLLCSHSKFCTGTMSPLSPHISYCSVTGAIFPSIFPPLIHTGAVELRLSQTDVDAIVNITEPLRESVATLGVRLIGF